MYLKPELWPQLCELYDGCRGVSLPAAEHRVVMAVVMGLRLETLIFGA